MLIFFLKRPKRAEKGRGRCSGLRFDFLVRERDFSLDFWLSDSFGARRKAVLRGKGNAWTPVLRSFDKLREVGVSSYLKLHFI